MLMAMTVSLGAILHGIITIMQNRVFQPNSAKQRRRPRRTLENAQRNSDWRARIIIYFIRFRKRVQSISSVHPSASWLRRKRKTERKNNIILFYILLLLARSKISTTQDKN